MVSVPSQSMVNPQVAKGLCRIVGFTCLAGFLLDMSAIALPFGAGEAWRIGVLQQLGDRSIVFLFGMALLLYGFWEERSQRKPLAYIALAVGVFFQICCLVVIRDGLVLQQETVENISSRAAEIQTQIEQSRTQELPPNVTPEQLEQAARQVQAQADSLKQNAKTGITKSSIASVGNLVIVGLGLIGLGRVGMRSRRS